jgi:hypothetical protein
MAVSRVFGVYLSLQFSCAQIDHQYASQAISQAREIWGTGIYLSRIFAATHRTIISDSQTVDPKERQLAKTTQRKTSSCFTIDQKGR